MGEPPLNPVGEDIGAGSWHGGKAGLVEPVWLLRAWPDQFLRLSKIFRAATCLCRLEICMLVA